MRISLSTVSLLNGSVNLLLKKSVCLLNKKRSIYSSLKEISHISIRSWSISLPIFIFIKCISRISITFSWRNCFFFTPLSIFYEPAWRSSFMTRSVFFLTGFLMNGFLRWKSTDLVWRRSVYTFIKTLTHFLMVSRYINLFDRSSSRGFGRIRQFLQEFISGLHISTFVFSVRERERGRE